MLVRADSTREGKLDLCYGSTDCLDRNGVLESESKVATRRRLDFH